MRIPGPGIPFLAALFFCGMVALFASCEKTLISHKTCESGRLDHVPGSIPDSVADGASYVLFDNMGQVNSYLHTWGGNTDMFQYLNRNVTIYGQTNTGYLSVDIKHIDVDSVKLN